MLIGCRPVPRVLSASLTALALLSACGANAGNSGQTSTSQTPITTALSTTTAIAAPPRGPEPHPEKWIDLQVGDCLADPPPTDPSVLTVTVVDCAAPHAAEVYSRAPVAVNAAVADVANQECAASFTQYTGRSLAGSPFTITYLIDSNQDRTTSNPTPSTVICVLQSANGQPVTGTARH